jgi:hypothetical protein
MESLAKEKKNKQVALRENGFLQRYCVIGTNSQHKD